MVQRVGLVRPVKELRCSIRIAVQRLILEIRVILPPKREPLPRRQVRIHRQCVLALIIGMPGRGKPVAVAPNVIREIGNRPGVQNTQPVRTPAAGGNDVAGEAAIGVVVAGRNDLATLRSRGRLGVPDEYRYSVACGIPARDERIVRIQQLAKISLAHFGGWNR